MLAGAGKSTVDLAGILPFDGFDEVRHPLCARALVLDAGERTCLVALEVTSIAPSLLEGLRAVVAEESGCAGASAWIGATHTFSAPHVRTPAHLASDEERERNVRLARVYADACRRAVAQAVSRLDEATVAFGEGALSIAVNRDVKTPAGWWLGADPAGFTDSTLPVVRIDRLSGEPVAVLSFIGVRSSVLDGSRTSAGLRQVSGDVAGFAAGALERALPGAVALLLPGAVADQSPRECTVNVSVTPAGEIVRTDAHEDGYRMLHQQGARLADELLEAYAAAQTVEVPSICTTVHTLELPGQKIAPFHTLAPHRSYAFEPADSVEIDVYVLDAGNLVLVGVQPELSAALGCRVRACGTRCPVLVGTLINGGAKYLPDADAYDKITYEAMNAPFARGADEVLVQDIHRCVAQPKAEEA